MVCLEAEPTNGLSHAQVFLRVLTSLSMIRQEPNRQNAVWGQQVFVTSINVLSGASSGPAYGNRPRFSPRHVKNPKACPQKRCLKSFTACLLSTKVSKPRGCPSLIKYMPSQKIDARPQKRFLPKRRMKSLLHCPKGLWASSFSFVPPPTLHYPRVSPRDSCDQ